MSCPNLFPETMSTVGGISNSALNNNDDADTASTVRVDDKSDCFQFIDSADNEYDEGLALPDSITIISSAEDDPRRILQKEEVDSSHCVVPTGEIPYTYVHNPPVSSILKKKLFIC
jgi:hypothetical protein